MRLLIFLLFTPIFTLSTAYAQDVSDLRRLRSTLIQGLSVKNDSLDSEKKLPELSETQFHSGRILMGIFFEALQNAPYLGFLNSHLTDQSKGSLSSSSLKSRYRFEETVPSIASIAPRYTYYSPHGGFSYKTFSKQYGNLLVELRESMKEYATYTVGDSGAEAGRARPLRLGYAPEETRDFTYFEAQVWSDMWLSDVKNIYVPIEIYESHTQWFLENAKRFGFGVTLIQWLGQNQPKVLRVEIHPNQAKLPLVSANEIKKFFEKNPDKKWVKALGRHILSLDEEIQKELLNTIPELKETFASEKEELTALLRLLLVDKSTHAPARVEALKLLAKIKPTFDFALIAPIQELTRNSKALEYARKINFNLQQFASLDPNRAPETKLADALIYHRAKQGFPLTTKEVRYIERAAEGGDPDFYKLLLTVKPEASHGLRILRAAESHRELLLPILKSAKLRVEQSENFTTQILRNIQKIGPRQISVDLLILINALRPTEISRQLLSAYKTEFAKTSYDLSHFKLANETLTNLSWKSSPHINAHIDKVDLDIARSYFKFFQSLDNVDEEQKRIIDYYREIAQQLNINESSKDSNLRCHAVFQ